MVAILADPSRRPASLIQRTRPLGEFASKRSAGKANRLYLVAVSDEQTTSSPTDNPVDPSHAWLELAPDYERARTREDSLDRRVEWPAQQELLGDVAGRSVLDLGCGNGGKLAELVRDGATASVGVDVSGNWG